MFTCAATHRGLPALRQSLRPIARGVSIRHSSSGAARMGKSRNFALKIAVPTIVAAGAATIATQYDLPFGLKEAYAEAAPVHAEPEFEKPVKRKGKSKEESRDLISSQHLQVKQSWEHPGVYAWGSNKGKVAAPDSDEAVIKNPRRIPYFDGVLLRDIKLDPNFGAAVNEQGDLLQWGIDYSTETVAPTKTLRGKRLVSITLSRDRIICLSISGAVYSVPVSKDAQEKGRKPSERSWIPFWSSASPISYRVLSPKNLNWGERIVSLSGGLEHVLLLTSKGRVFSAAAGSEDFPSRGQLGIPGLTWNTRPIGSYDQCHELTALRGFDIKQVASGDYHSIVQDKDGRVFTFGDNSVGQLGLEYNPEAPFVDSPALLPIQSLYQGTGQVPKVTSIAAGGVNSFFTIDATGVALPQSEEGASSALLGRVTADTWSCGQGLWGSLGTGRWIHIQDNLVKIKALSGLFEYDETTNKVVPIRLSHLSVGATHVAAVLNNVTHLTATESTSTDDTNWGSDLLLWGANEFFQLGTGKRNNISAPTYIHPLYPASEKAEGRDKEHRLQLTPWKTIKINNRKVKVEQRVECGRNITAIYTAVG
ncbi:RCC1/BLIP-II protein [Xylona heveae TC161]|uniref:RCC1/BLIP-II protein n=1 Tax=Xylona heveae (strain CBS 132557 / TC161) TaxID=1328760 RepID=A0A165GL98_XYLHT|nr:RCC1/BLIP-II protein [Xylona heveae TC161]KZF22329.1 RCC1/BLIP-II protein [Xylona heveae TC161]